MAAATSASTEANSPLRGQRIESVYTGQILDKLLLKLFETTPSNIPLCSQLSARQEISISDDIGSQFYIDFKCILSCKTLDCRQTTAHPSSGSSVTSSSSNSQSGSFSQVENAVETTFRERSSSDSRLLKKDFIVNEKLFRPYVSPCTKGCAISAKHGAVNYYHSDYNIRTSLHPQNNSNLSHLSNSSSKEGESSSSEDCMLWEPTPKFRLIKPKSPPRPVPLVDPWKCGLFEPVIDNVFGSDDSLCVNSSNQSSPVQPKRLSAVKAAERASTSAAVEVPEEENPFERNLRDSFRRKSMIELRPHKGLDAASEFLPKKDVHTRKPVAVNKQPGYVYRTLIKKDQDVLLVVDALRYCTKGRGARILMFIDQTKSVGNVILYFQSLTQFLHFFLDRAIEPHSSSSKSVPNTSDAPSEKPEYRSSILSSEIKDLFYSLLLPNSAMHLSAKVKIFKKGIILNSPRKYLKRSRTSNSEDDSEEIEYENRRLRKNESLGENESLRKNDVAICVPLSEKLLQTPTNISSPGEMDRPIHLSVREVAMTMLSITAKILTLPSSNWADIHLKTTTEYLQMCLRNLNQISSDSSCLRDVDCQYMLELAHSLVKMYYCCIVNTLRSAIFINYDVTDKFQSLFTIYQNFLEVYHSKEVPESFVGLISTLLCDIVLGAANTMTSICCVEAETSEFDKVLGKVKNVFSSGFIACFPHILDLVMNESREYKEYFLQSICDLVFYFKVCLAKSIHLQSCSENEHNLCQYNSINCHHSALLDENSTSVKSACIVSTTVEILLKWLSHCDDVQLCTVIMNNLAQSGLCCCIKMSCLLRLLFNRIPKKPLTIRASIMTFIENVVWPQKGLKNDSQCCQICQYELKRSRGKQRPQNCVGISHYSMYVLHPTLGESITKHLATLVEISHNDIGSEICRKLVIPSIKKIMTTKYLPLRTPPKTSLLVLNNLIKSLRIISSSRAEQSIINFLDENAICIVNFCKNFTETRPESIRLLCNVVSLKLQEDWTDLHDEESRSKSFPKRFVLAMEEYCVFWVQTINQICEVEYPGFSVEDIDYFSIYMKEDSNNPAQDDLSLIVEECHRSNIYGEFEAMVEVWSIVSEYAQKYEHFRLFLKEKWFHLVALYFLNLLMLSLSHFEKDDSCVFGRSSAIFDLICSLLTLSIQSLKNDSYRMEYNSLNRALLQRGTLRCDHLRRLVAGVLQCYKRPNNIKSTRFRENIELDDLKESSGENSCDFNVDYDADGEISDSLLQEGISTEFSLSSSFIDEESIAELIMLALRLMLNHQSSCRYAQMISSPDNQADDSTKKQTLLNLPETAEYLEESNQVEHDTTKDTITEEEPQTDHVFSMAQCFHSILVICKKSEIICRSLQKQEFLKLLLPGFETFIEQNDDSFNDLSFAVFNLWGEIAQYQLKPAELSQFLGFFKFSRPPLALLLRPLQRAFNRVEEPQHSLQFPSSAIQDKNHEFGDSLMSVASLQSFVEVKTPTPPVVEAITTLRENQIRNDCLQSSICKACLACPIPRFLDWSPYNDGFSVAFWVALKERKLDRNNRTAGTETSSRLNDKYHVLSVGTKCLMFSLWFDPIKGLLHMRASRETDERSIIHGERAVQGAPLERGWHHISFSVSGLNLRKPSTIQVTVFVDAVSKRILEFDTPAVGSMRKSIPTVLLLGHVVGPTTEVNKTNINADDHSTAFSMGNVFLFKRCILNPENNLSLFALGKNVQNLLVDASDSHKILLPHHIDPALLSSGIDLSCLFKDLRIFLSQLQVNLIFLYSANCPSEFVYYHPILHTLPELSLYQYPKCESSQVIKFGEIKHSENRTPAVALLQMGGVPQLAFMVARIAELSYDEKNIAEGLRILFSVYRSNPTLALQFARIGGGNLIIRLLYSTLVPSGACVLKAFLDACISGTFMLYDAPQQTYVLSSQSILLLRDCELLDSILTNWRCFLSSADNANRKYKCVNGGGEELRGIGITLSAIKLLLSVDSPYKTFNLIQMRNSRTLRKILQILEEMVVEKLPLDDLCPVDLLVEVISLLMEVKDTRINDTSRSDEDIDREVEIVQSQVPNTCFTSAHQFKGDDLNNIGYFLLLLHHDVLTYIPAGKLQAYYMSQLHDIVPLKKREAGVNVMSIPDAEREVNTRVCVWTLRSNFSSSDQNDISSTTVEEAEEVLPDCCSLNAVPETSNFEPGNESPATNNQNITTENEDRSCDSDVTQDTRNEAATTAILITTGLLHVLEVAISQLSETIAALVIGEIFEIEVLIILANNPNSSVRAAILKLFNTILRRSHRTESNFNMKRHVMHLISHQLYKHNSVSVDLLNEAFALALKVPFDFESTENEDFILTPYHQLKSFVPLLSILPSAVQNISMCQKAIMAIGNIIRKNEDMLLRIFYKTHIVDSFMLTIRNALNVQTCPRDVTVLPETHILVYDVRAILCHMVKTLIASSTRESFATFLEIVAHINLMGRIEYSKWGECSASAMLFRHVESAVLSAAILQLQNDSSGLRQASSEITINREATVETREVTPNVQRSRSFQSLRSLASFFNLRDDSELRELRGNSDDTNAAETSRSSAAAREDMYHGILAERYKIILQKSMDFIYTSAEEESFEQPAIEEFVLTILRTLIDSLIVITDDPRTEHVDNTFERLSWTCKDAILMHFTLVITCIMAPKAYNLIRRRVIIDLAKELKIKKVISYCCKRNMPLMYRFGIFVYEYAYGEDIDLNIIHPGVLVLKTLRECSVSVLPPPGEPLVEWPVVVQEEERLWRDKELEIMSVVKNKLIQQDSRLLAKNKVFFQRVCSEANQITSRVVRQKDKRRKDALRRVKEAQFRNIKFTRIWKDLSASVTHEQATWHFPNSYPNGWKLDNTEGPLRMRKRFKRTKLNIDAKFYKPEFISNNAVPAVECYSPLNGLLVDGAIESAVAHMVESINEDEEIIHMSHAVIVSPNAEEAGEFLISHKNIYFIGEEFVSGDKTCAPGVVSRYWSSDVIKEINERWYQLKDCALELFSIRGDSALFAFDNTQQRNEAMKFLKSLEFPNMKNETSLLGYTNRWKEGTLTNFEYLTQLNKWAGRSFNDLMQYPVFPFILADYESNEIDLEDASIYRNLRKPIPIQKQIREAIFKTNYENTKQMCTDGPYHYVSHYSNSVIVLYYLVRLPPFTEMFLEFQDGNFDVPDRSFHSLGTTWRLASSESTTAIRELIPEFFFLPEMFLNSQGFNFGQRQNGDEVDHTQLPSWALDDPRRFVLVHRAMLESVHVTKNLSHWIDLVFGYKQTGRAAVEAVNVFHPSTYFGFDVDKCEDELSLQARRTMIRTYGQTPRQLFSSHHPSSTSAHVQLLKAAGLGQQNLKPVLDLVNGVPWGVYAGSPADSKLTVQRLLVLQHNIGAMVARSSNEILLLPTCAAAYIITDKKDHPVTFTISWNHQDGVIRCKRLRDTVARPLTTVPIHNKVTCCTISQKQIWFGTDAGQVLVYLVRPFQNNRHLSVSIQTLPLTAHSKSVSCLYVSESFKLCLSGGLDGLVVIWDTNRLSYIRSVAIMGGVKITHVTMSETLGDWISVTSFDGVSAMSYYTVNGKLIDSVNIDTEVNDVVFSSVPEGRNVNVIATCLADGSIRLYSTWDLKHLRTLTTKKSSEAFYCIYFTPDCNHLCAITYSKLLFVWTTSQVKTKLPKFINTGPL